MSGYEHDRGFGFFDFANPRVERLPAVLRVLHAGIRMRLANAYRSVLAHLEVAALVSRERSADATLQEFEEFGDVRVFFSERFVDRVFVSSFPEASHLAGLYATHFFREDGEFAVRAPPASYSARGAS